MKNMNAEQMIKKLTLAIVTVCMIGCASGPQFSDYAKRLPQPNQGDGRIWLYRPQRVLGAAIQPAVTLNGQKVGTAQPGGFFYADRPAGNYEVGCTTEWTHKCHLTLAPQSNRYVRLNMMPGLFVGHVVPIEADATDAAKELQELRAND
jgi:Protein of unknown function (DUF2846)